MDIKGNITAFDNKHVSVRIIVMVTCLLSVFGSTLIIFSYIFKQTLRSQGRLILVHLAAMDLTVALSNFIGACVNFDRYYISLNTTSDEVTLLVPSSGIRFLCKFQAGIAHIGTEASVLWTASLAIYMFVLIFINRQKNSVRHYVQISSYVCYIIPAITVFILYCSDRLGHSPEDEAAWCGLIANTADNRGDSLVQFFGYDLWIYLTMILSVSVYPFVTVRLHFLIKQRDAEQKLEQWKDALKFLDRKLLLIPVSFILLRIWTTILNIVLTYANVSVSNIPTDVSTAFIYLSGIGDSGQGAVNGLLFVLIPSEVRKELHMQFSSTTTRGGPSAEDGEERFLVDSNKIN